MTYHPGWGHSPPPSAPEYPPSRIDEPHHHGNLSLMLGRLIGQGDHVIYRLGIIDQRLTAGSEKMDEHDERLDKLEAARMSGDHIPRWEQMVKRWAAWLIPIGVFVGTGQLATALQWAKLLK